MEARQRVEEALGAARSAADDAAAREARRLVEEGIREQGDRLAEESVPAGHRGEWIGCDRGRLARATGHRQHGRSAGAALGREGRGRDGLDAHRRPTPAELTVLPRAPETAACRARTRWARLPGTTGLPRDRPPRHDRGRGRAGDRRRGGCRGAGGATVPAHHSRYGHGRGARAGATGRLQRPPRSRGFGFAPRNQGGTGVTIVEFSA